MMRTYSIENRSGESLTTVARSAALAAGIYGSCRFDTSSSSPVIRIYRANDDGIGYSGRPEIVISPLRWQETNVLVLADLRRLPTSCDSEDIQFHLDTAAVRERSKRRI